MTILRSPAEPKGILRTVGDVSPLPEQYGADWLILTSDGLVGVQRKTCADLIASTRADDRIAREIGQSRSLVRMVLIVEGDWRWEYGVRTESKACPGVLKAQVDGMFLSFQNEGWWVLSSGSMADTARLVNQCASWFAKGSHNTLLTRQKADGLWGTWTNRDWGRHWWQSIDGIGPELAGRLYDAFGCPVVWTITEADLCTVRGVARPTAQKILASLPTVDMERTLVR